MCWFTTITYFRVLFLFKSNSDSKKSVRFPSLFDWRLILPLQSLSWIFSEVRSSVAALFFWINEGFIGSFSGTKSQQTTGTLQNTVLYLAFLLLFSCVPPHTPISADSFQEETAIKQWSCVIAWVLSSERSFPLFDTFYSSSLCTASVFAFFFCVCTLASLYGIA